MEKHFPGCMSTPNLNLQPPNLLDTEVVSIITVEKVKWAILTFEDFKSPGLDGIVPKMLKGISDFIAPILSIIYRDCLKFNYMPISWRRVKVVFIPKAGKVNHSTAKDYRPISLSSFLLKILENK